MTKKKLPALDYSRSTYQHMADHVRAIGLEVKSRNPIFVNAYMQPIIECIVALEEISGGEKGNFTSEHGPREV